MKLPEYNTVLERARNRAYMIMLLVFWQWAVALEARNWTWFAALSIALVWISLQLRDEWQVKDAQEYFGSNGYDSGDNL